MQIQGSVEAILAQINDDDKIKLCVGTGMLDTKMPSPAQGSVGHTAYHLASLGVENLEMADGPSGLRLQTRYGVYPNGKAKMITPQMNSLNYLPKYIKRFIFADPNKCEIFEQPTTAFPVGTNIAQTWNTAMAEEVGYAVSREMDEYLVPRDPLNADRTGLIRWQNGAWCVNFGKKKGTPLKELFLHEQNFLKWFVKGNFETDARMIVQDLLERGVLPPAPQI